MKKILVTGKNSYIGNAFESWLIKSENEYKIDKISVRDNAWREMDFSQYDTILHLAGIAHVSRNPNMEALYYQVNRDLTIEIAKKAKLDGVNQFIFMSSIIVYGESTNENKVIDMATPLNPSNFYGKSKLQAEEGINELANPEFKVVVIRPPMIYGEDSKGNYPKLAKLARKVPLFPDIDNKRSMLFVENLCEFIKLMIDNEEAGLFFPQNKEYIKTSELVKTISEVHGKRVILTKLFNPMILPIVKRVETFNKLFGDLVFDQSLSLYRENYQIRGFKDSIKRTEGGN